MATLRVTGMTCASCSNAVEKALGALGGVEQASVSLSLEQAEVRFDPSLVTEVRAGGQLGVPAGRAALAVANRASLPRPSWRGRSRPPGSRASWSAAQLRSRPTSSWSCACRA